MESSHVRSVTVANNGLVTSTTVQSTHFDRSCTDVICLVLYLILVAACAFVVLGGVDRNPYHNKPYDVDHQPCFGRHRYLYIPSLGQGSVCVSFCPGSAGIPLDCRVNNAFPVCPLSVSGLIRNQVYKICHTMAMVAPRQNPLKTFWNLIIQFKQIITEGAIYAVCISFVILMLVLLGPEIMGCFVMILFQLVLLGLSFVCLYRYFIDQTLLDQYIPYYFRSTRLLLIIGTFFLIMAILSLIILCYRTLLSRQIGYLISILKISRIVLIRNLHFLGISALLSVLTLGAFHLNTLCLRSILGLVYIDHRFYTPYDQAKLSSLGVFMFIVWLIQFLWTHGLLISLSHWLFQVASTFYYYNPSSPVYTITSTFRLTFIHIGSVIFGSYYPYYSQNLASFMNNIQRNCSFDIYNCLCCIHNCCCRYLHIYSYTQIALKSLPFWSANIQFYQIRERMRHNYPSLYMIGYFFNSVFKNLIILVSIVITYVLLVREDGELFMNLWYLVPCLLVSGIISSEIATFWGDLAGTVADTIVINYYMEREYHMINGTPLSQTSCDPEILEQLVKANHMY